MITLKRVVALLFLSLFVLPVRGEILKVEIDGPIEPIVAGFIRGAVQEANRTKAEFLLIRLATPGGLGVSMQDIIQDILNSEVPIVCFVSPRGSHAASAGFFILLASDVAAMAPGTNTGAAHPVFPLGMEDKVMLEKVTNDALANLRSIVERRHRNYELAEQGVLESKSYTSTEALEGGLIDLVADDEAALLEKLEGFEVTRFSGEKQKLTVRGQSIRHLEMSLRERVLSSIANPSLALVLGLIGLVGLYIEFSAPGHVAPGAIGAVCLLLALVGFSLLPVNYVGVLLILLAIGLFIAEVFVAGFGVLGIAGAVSLVFGLLFLIDSPYPGLRIGLFEAIVIALPFAAIFLVFFWVLFKNRVTHVSTGREGLEGLVGVSRSRVDPEGGKVFVNSEWWNAVSASPIEKGVRVRVVKVEGLTLTVEPIRSA